MVKRFKYKVDCLFEAVKLTKNADFEKYRYSSYGVGFYSQFFFFLPGVSRVKMLLFLVRTIVYQ